MISEDGDFTVAAILKSMGDLSKERIIAKHAARLGLKLSTTRALGTPVQIEVIEDIQRNSYTFTDGVGHCTQALATEAAHMLGHRSTPCSAVQIRCGGAKGVLSVVLDERLGKYVIRERPSMRKIIGSSSKLAVIKVSTFSRATLNRQAILLMEDRGVTKETLVDIFRMEKERIEELDNGFDPARLAAITTFPLKGALNHKVDDQMVENIKRLVKCRMLSDLKHKAWIEIRESVFLLGTLVELL